MVKIVQINSREIIFSDNSKLYSEHDQSCCEKHFLSFEDLDFKELKDLEFNLEDLFFNRINDYGIELLPVNGFPVRIPGYAYNNGYYSSNLTLVLENKDGSKKTFNISECQSDI